jgi:tripartite-type tricarboxylate transporter receptor subunit TctC
VNAAPDGYTLLLAANPNAVNATLYQKLNFNFLRDIALIAPVSRAPNLVVVPASFPAKTIPEFIAYAKGNPAKINMGSGGNGAVEHIFGELFKI